MDRETMRAIFNGQTDTVDAKLSGQDVNTLTEKEHWNLLHRSMVNMYMRAKPQMIQHLIDLGVDVNAKDVYGNAPLHYATRCKDLELVQIVIAAGAEIDCENNKGQTPLWEALATTAHDLDIIKTLIDCGANPNHQPRGARTLREYVTSIADGVSPELKELFQPK